MSLQHSTIILFFVLVIGMPFQSSAQTLSAPTLNDPGEIVNPGQPISLTWTSISGATGYSVEKSRDHAFSNPARTEVREPAMTYIINRSPEEMTLFFRVKARNTEGSGSWSNVVNILVTRGEAPRREAVPDVPPALSATLTSAQSNQTYRLNWTTSEAARGGFFLVESTDPSFPARGGRGVNLSDRSYSFFHQVTQSTIYYYRVRVSDSSGITRPWSNTIQVTVQPQAAVQALAAPVVRDPGERVNPGQSIRLAWAGVSGATGYTVEKSLDMSFSNPQRTGVSSPSMTYSINRAERDTPYYFRVSARNDEGAGPWSNAVDIIVNQGEYRQVRTPGSAPTLSINRTSVLSDQTYVLSWSAMLGVRGYFLVESPDSRFPASQGRGVNTTATSYSFVHEVTQPTTYYYRVRVSKGGDQSEWSNVVPVTVNPQ
ncbi:MAG: fibronectin type III domain-containing protein [Deltaproteobacteria bacterium]|nr:fibronectin type III domain-containing protein [Deltaproteobacteria bacterium]